MKKILLIYVAVLAGLFAVFSLLGTNSEYAVEQRVWKVQKEYLDILKDPKVIPEQTFQGVIRKYERIITRHPDSRLTPGLRMLVGNVYSLKKDYETARRKFNEIIGLYPDNKELQAQALAAIGRTFEAQGDWPQAKKTYDRILMDYTLTQTGLGVPMYLVNHYKEQKDDQKTMEAYGRAVAHYDAVAAQNPDSAAEYAALRYLGNCYLDQKRWREAVETFGRVLSKYARAEYMSPQAADMIVKTINTVSVYQLKDYDLAGRIYQDIIEQHPHHPLKAYFQKMLDALNTLKAKSVQISPEPPQQ